MDLDPWSMTFQKARSGYGFGVILGSIHEHLMVPNWELASVEMHNAFQITTYVQ